MALAVPITAVAKDAFALLNTYGMPGLIDMPTAETMPDAELGGTVAFIGDTQRNTLSFQITPRLTGSFRYSVIPDYDADGDRFDRSFDLHYQLFRQYDYFPSLAIGLRDMMGTGLYSSEYIVATKALTGGVRVTAGLGWGRMGSFGDIGTPFGDRPGRDADDQGGEPNTNQWFRGPAAPFAGIEWRPNARWSLIAEYSSDAYEAEEARGLIDRRSPLNFGVSYRPRPGMAFGAHYLYGDTFGVTANFTLNPKRPPNDGSRDAAPFPVKPRAAGAHDLGWALDTGGTEALKGRVVSLLASDGFDVQSIALDGDSIRLRVRNTRYDYEPQAIGRIARILTGVLPPSVETFEILPVENGVALSAVTLRRSDLEELEHAPEGARLSFARAGISAAPPRAPGEMTVPGRFPQFEWGLAPYVSTALFDPDNPLRADAGLQLGAEYELAPGFVLSGALRGKVLGNRDASDRDDPSELPRVRSDYAEYHKQGEFGIHYLTLEHFGKLGPDVYSRLSLGYLEEMYGGVSGEVLWKPVDQRLALGVEVNYVQQRDFDKGFGFQDYDVVTGHASAYLDFGGGYTGQLDVGRYLAGDWGATVSLDREFDNGWRVGAYATLTDVSAEEFGEGSFDKGIRLTIPFSWLAGTSTRESYDTVIQPITRDGGARLNVNNRLYDTVSDYHRYEMYDEWGRFWR